jgi:hypothetical protein
VALKVRSLHIPPGVKIDINMPFDMPSIYTAEGFAAI